MLMHLAAGTRSSRFSGLELPLSPPHQKRTTNSCMISDQSLSLVDRHTSLSNGAMYKMQIYKTGVTHYRLLEKHQHHVLKCQQLRMDVGYRSFSVCLNVWYKCRFLFWWVSLAEWKLSGLLKPSWIRNAVSSTANWYPAMFISQDYTHTHAHTHTHTDELSFLEQVSVSWITACRIVQAVI